ncbi:MAG: hypothetical protein LPK80_11430 [Bacteroidota bacterium]|nr:hypothetical protein [Bacteroidota bacterium]MDX5427421.1 hypothetical protein [Bacteroidota bacterium]MDX5448416.1 hypothetical protein [Bacteroidota bacterium]MDX5505366.1 hypothetical protein [Bacteroidota bacterium]
MSKQKKDPEKKSGYVKERKAMAHENITYSIGKIDTLVVSVSGAGLYVVLETIRHFLQKDPNELWMVKLAGVFFVIAIIFNFISQKTSLKSATYDYMYWDAIGKEKDDDTCKKYDITSELANNQTKSFNLASIICMLIGLGLVVLFFGCFLEP